MLVASEAPMHVLVGYASAYGSTKGIAEAIGDRLASSGHAVDVRPLHEELTPLEGYDAVVLGSAIHNQRWLPQAAAFIWSHDSALAVRPVWLFSVSSVGGTSSFFGRRIAALMRRIRPEPKGVAKYRQVLHPRDHRNFAGAVERTHWDLLGNLFLRALGGTYGDHRDWDDIARWADEIAHQLDSHAPRGLPS
jgi:menaquinone-dependent protoporphyrinogen oxidase